MISHRRSFYLMALLVLTPCITVPAHPPLQGASWSFVLLGPPPSTQPSYSKFRKFLTQHTSLTMTDEAQYISADLTEIYRHPWLFVQDMSAIRDASSSASRTGWPQAPPGGLHPQLVRWLLHGGTLIIASSTPAAELAQLTAAPELHQGGTWQPIGADHELQRSFYLLAGMPPCGEHSWQEFRLDQRMAILIVPAGLVAAITDTPATANCWRRLGGRHTFRLMTNLIMVILTTNYKQDQIHIRETLKRIR